MAKGVKMKKTLHLIVLEILSTFFPNLFTRYYSEYKYMARQLRRKQKRVLGYMDTLSYRDTKWEKEKW